MHDLIDYTENSTEDEPSRWTVKAFKKHFTDTYWKVHKIGGAVPWTMKEQVQLSRMMKEYAPDNLSDMILYWHINTDRAAISCEFTNFYSNRVATYHDMKKVIDDYRWE